MNKLLTAKHWQIFILIIVGLFIQNMTIEDGSIINAVLKIAGIVVYAIYPLIAGHFLHDYLPKKSKLNHDLFLINVFIWITFYSVVMILSEGQGMKFNGLIALPLFYAFYASFHSMAFPARTIKSIELGKKASFGEYLGEFFLILFLPIGIWFLQPRINKIIKSRQLMNEENQPFA